MMAGIRLRITTLLLISSGLEFGLAQTVNGTFHGTATDSSGRALPGVLVEVVNGRGA